MKVLLDIQDDKASAVMEILNNLPFVKTKEIKKSKKQQLIDDLKEAIEDVKLAKAGKLKLKSLDEFLNEL